MKKVWLIASPLVLLIVVLAAWQARRPKAVVEVIHPRVQTIRAYVEEQAVTQLPHDYLIAMPISGWLKQITLREGDAVARGQVIAGLDTEDLADRVHQAQQRIAVLETRLRQNADNRLEENALVETEATVKAIDETVAAAEAKLEAAKAVWEFADAELERIRALAEGDAASDRELHAANMEARKARAQYQSDGLELAALKTLAAVSYIGPKFIRDYTDRKRFQSEEYEKQLEEVRAALEIEKRNLARTEIRAPIDGVVLRRHETRRQFLPAGTPLLTLGRLDDLEVVAEVLTERATRLSPQDPVEIFGQAIEDGPLAGRVARVEPAGFKKISSLGVEQQRVNVIIALDHRPERLGVAFRVHVRIFHDEARDALTLPRTALFRGRGGQWQVMTVDDGVTRLKPVEVGLMNDETLQITSGLTEQSAVVARPSGEIKANMRVGIQPGD